MRRRGWLKVSRLENFERNFLRAPDNSHLAGNIGHDGEASRIAAERHVHAIDVCGALQARPDTQSTISYVAYTYL